MIGPGCQPDGAFSGVNISQPVTISASGGSYALVKRSSPLYHLLAFRVRTKQASRHGEDSSEFDDAYP